MKFFGTLNAHLRNLRGLKDHNKDDHLEDLPNFWLHLAHQTRAAGILIVQSRLCPKRIAKTYLRGRSKRPNVRRGSLAKHIAQWRSRPRCSGLCAGPFRPRLSLGPPSCTGEVHGSADCQAIGGAVPFALQM